uniref:Uncharacterized protein n=1 Tax=Emiliania huxleyi TaxID=2903 RepID=A0A7S3TBT1_EMIHU
MPAQPEGNSTRSCTFFMLSADFVRQFPGKSLPFFQEIRDDYTTEEPLVEVALDYADVVKGTHIETTLAVSHRWMQPDDPDPDGEQLKALKGFLNSPAGKKIERVWIDSACMPQDHPKGSRSAEDAAAFKRMLKEVNRLYLGTTVLILLDLSYVSRFWTQFESWLSMQFVTPDGLKPAVGTKNERHHIVCIQNAAEQSELHEKMLIQSWATKTPEQAHSFLSKPDVTVTNQGDKDLQLPKIKALDATVQGAFGDISRSLEDELAASEAVAARARAELAAWEAENDAKAGEKNRLKVAARQAASAVAAARLAKEEHARAISSSVDPAMMKRAEAASAEDSLSMSDVPELVLHLSGGGDKRKEQAAAALAKLARNADNRVAIAKAGGIAPLVALARGGTEVQKEYAAGALRILAVNDDNAMAIATAFGQLSFESSAKKVSIEQHGRRCRSTSICLVFCSPPLEKMLVPRVRLRLLEKTDSYTYVGAAPADVESHNKALGQDYGLGFATDGTTRFFSTKVKSADRARAFRIDDEIELRYDTSKGVVQLWAKNGKGAFVMINEHGPIPRGYRFAIGCVYCRCTFELLS